MNNIPIAIWVAGIAAFTGVFGVLLNFFLGKNLQRIDLEIKNYMAQAQSELTQISAPQLGLKEFELKSIAAGKVADVLLRRYEALRNDVRDILALLTLYQYERGPFSEEIKKQAFSLCHSRFRFSYRRKECSTKKLTFSSGISGNFSLTVHLTGGIIRTSILRFVGIAGCCWMRSLKELVEPLKQVVS